MEDTIAAISTPVGAGGIAIVRLTGLASLTVADAVFRAAEGRASSFASHTIHLGVIHRDGEVIDQVLLTVMHAPRTYTGEITVEINCHGGPLVARTILGLCLEHGARLAEPGEFTKRAFLNGKLDLAQAEAVMDLISAHTQRAQAAAVRALEGQLSASVNALREDLIGVLAHIEAHLDFPEEDISPDALDMLGGRLQEALDKLGTLLRTARDGRILRHGIAVTIVGRPNVGKSSLMNALLGRDRAIVTQVPGTTRDTIEDFLSIDGIPIKLTDTAGMRTARSEVEQIGVERSRKSLEISDIVLHVMDGARTFSGSDQELISQFADKKVLLVINKLDLGQRLVFPESAALLPAVRISAKTGQGLDLLKSKLVELIHLGSNGAHAAEVLINERHEKALTAAHKTLTEVLTLISHQTGLEIIAQRLRIALDLIGEVVGKTTTDDILDRVFSSFCIGK